MKEIQAKEIQASHHQARNTHLRRRRISASCGIIVASLCFTVFAMFGVSSGVVTSVAPKLSKGEAERLIRRFAGGDFGGDNVEIVGEVSTLGSSATVEAQVKTAFRFAREADAWRVAEVRTGENRWEDVALITAALNNEKRLRARAELELIRAALESYRRERGFYVVASDGVVLIDALAPRFLARVIRVDPWHQPYRYQGTTNAFALSSDGADGTPNTPDDILVRRDKQESGARSQEPE
ncbi:MAG: type II secretion system protein GspG [Pyrinomonadaceae bacterium MAG19_C2-C3]|nr:type II secretion system protein GspG [Pyrinomonadaceae bacterium MAG19_C2-C3]